MSTATNVVGTANSIIDSLQAIAENPAVGLIGLLFPQVTSVIDVIRRYGPTIDAAQPVIAKAVEAGEPVFEKAVEAFPKFATAVSAIMHLAPAIYGATPGLAAENVARVLGRFPRMTAEEERAWMDRATPGNDPSQENSKFQIG